jgi:hypothetical protein
MSGCSVNYTIPDADSDEIGKVVSSGYTPKGCLENLKEEGQQLGVKVKLTDMNHENAGPVSWLWTHSYTCTGKVVGKLR